MKKQHVFLSFLMVTLLLSLALNSCKKDTATPLTLGTLTAGSIDLNGATSPNTVPVDATLTATFATEVDPATAIAANITLTEDYDALSIPLNISVSGKVITITFVNKLANGALYKLVFGAGLKATNGLTLTAINRTFTTVGSFLPAGVFAYWNLDGNANDQNGVYNASASGIIDITYETGRNATSGQAAKFNGTTSLIEIPNGNVLENSSDFSLSFWVKPDTTAKRSQFIMGLGGWYGFQVEYNSNIYGTQIGQIKLAAQYSLSDGTSASQDLWLDGNGATKDNGGWQGWTFSQNLVANNGTGVNGLLAQKWAHIVCTYDHATKIGTMYINGQKMKQQDFNLYGAGHPLLNAIGLKFAGNAANNSLALGFIQDKTSPSIPDSWADYNDPANNHFKGLLDDIAIYHSVLTPTLITLMYNSGKP
jgi:hypothetical protein